MQAVTITQITPPELATLIEDSIKRVLSGQSQSSPIQSDELLTVQDAAKFLTLSVPTIYGLIAKNELPVMKRSKRCYFSKTELVDYIKQGRKKTVEETEKEATDYVKGKAK